MWNESTIRVGSFFSILILIALFEFFFPRRKLIKSKLRRWITNLSLVIFNTFLLRILLIISAEKMAYIAQSKNWGLLNIVELPVAISFLLGILLLDLIIYFQHQIFHLVPILWRLHRVHHLDMDLDVTSGLRFHPLEIILSMLLKFAVIIALGISPISVLVFEVILNSAAMFNHGNFYIPIKLDKFLRLFIVTPDMHRVHHSTDYKESNTNFGFNFPWWDRIFKTYLSQPVKGQIGMDIGIKDIRDGKTFSLSWLLISPFI
jgi:sterol desaturase/sphingolipid hydroxylase (fatty acid hydroxylase superfamily)